ncbi:hypothetical protein, partial [Megasphaera sp.]|uniref:hypothetical protein n=1 Tax=Megasphaera sp. TaxID=2023260 RepID=UPI003FF00A23
MASLYKKRALWSRVLFQDILLDHAGIEVFKAREQAFHLIGDLLTAAFFGSLTLAIKENRCEASKMA